MSTTPEVPTDPRRTANGGTIPLTVPAGPPLSGTAGRTAPPVGPPMHRRGLPSGPASRPPARRDPTPTRGWRWVLALVAAVVLVAAGVVAGQALDDSGSSGAPAPAAAAAPTQSDSDPAEPLLDGTGTEPIVDVARVVSPSVVQIETGEGLGAGIVYDADGLILTAAHVVTGASQVDVRLADGTLVDGQVVGTHDATDVGVVSIDAVDGLVPATLALGVEIQVGQQVVALGSPFGLAQTVTHGIISAVDRPSQTPGGTVGMLQTDAPINPGNSGGALVDLGGRVVGINDAIVSQSGGNDGVGFAIPIDTAKSVADRLVAGETVEQARLGVEGDNPAVGRAGALIADVVSGSPAEEAGIQVGDLVVAFDGDDIQGMNELAAAVGGRAPGDEVTLTVVRGAGEIELGVTLGSTEE